MSDPRRRPRCTLLVLAKAPVPGQVKTRLFPVLTAADAAELAAAALLDTLDTVRRTPAVARIAAFSGDLSRAPRFRELQDVLAGFTVIEQRGADLAQRIAAAHHDAALIGGAPVLQLGMDTPQVTADLLTECAQTLAGDDSSALLGPACDGGWWLLGLHEPGAARALESVPMSLPTTGDHTAAALRGVGLDITYVAALRDVDTPADVPLVARQCARDSRFRATAHTLGLLRS